MEVDAVPNQDGCTPQVCLGHQKENWHLGHEVGDGVGEVPSEVQWLSSEFRSLLPGREVAVAGNLQ